MRYFLLFPFICNYIYYFLIFRTSLKLALHELTDLSVRKRQSVLLTIPFLSTKDRTFSKDGRQRVTMMTKSQSSCYFFSKNNMNSGIK